MSKPNDKRRTSKSGLPAGVEIHGDRLRKKVMVDGKRVSFTHLPGCLEWTHAVELYDYCEAVREANRRSLPIPAKPWERAVDDPRRLVRRGMSYFDYATEVVLPRWEATVGNPIKLHTFDHRRRFLLMHVLSAFRPQERNWVRLPIDRIDFVEVEEWMLRRKAELVADQRRIQAGAPAPTLPGKAEWSRVREWAMKQGLPGISASASKPSHTLLELYRAAYSADPSAPSAPLLPSSEALDFAVWVAKAVFNEAVKDARILGVAVNPLAALKTGWYGRDTGIVRRKTNKRKPADPDEIRRIAARLHPAHRLPLWLGVIMGLRIGEIFGLPVRLWDPVEKVIHIEQQFGRWREAEGAPLRYIKPWTKSDASKAYLWVPDSLADLITAEIERVYGHSLDDHWWGEPVQDPWDPLIKTRRDLPICVHPAGQRFAAGRVTTFWDALRKAAQAEGIDLRRLNSHDKGDEIEGHDLRRTIAAHIHENQWGSDRVRSAFLRHKHKGTWEDSDITAEHYTAVVEQGLRDLVATIEEQFIPLLGPLAPPPVPTGADRLVDINEARKLLGMSDRGIHAVRDRLARRGIKPVPNQWGFGRYSYYRVGDLDQFSRPSGENLSTTEVAALLWPDEKLTADAAGNRVRRARARGGLQRVGRVGRDWFYDEASALELARLYGQRRAGELILRTDAAAEFGLRPRFPFEQHGIEVHVLDIDGRHRSGEYVRLSDVATFVATRQTERLWSLKGLAREWGMSFHTVKKMVGAAGREHVDPTRITDAAVEYLLEHRDELLAVGWNATDVASPPQGTTWVSVAEAARQLGITQESVRKRARLNQWRAVRHQGVLYVQRSRLAEPPVRAGFAPSSQVLERLGLGTSGLNEVRHLARSSWTSMEVGPNKRLFVELASITRWLQTEIEAQRLLTSEQARARLGVGRGRFQTLVLEGVLAPKLSPNGLPGWTASRSRLFDPARVDRLLKAHTPPAGWITEAEAARRAAITPIALQARAERRNWRVVIDMTGTRWLDPADVVDEHVDVTGMLTAAELLALAGFSVTRTLTSRVAKMARTGALPGALLAVPTGGRSGRQWWFPDTPELLAQLRERITSGSATYAKQAEAGKAYHATVRELNRQGSSLAASGQFNDGGECSAAATCR